jgi:hypothetical protein
LAPEAIVQVLQVVIVILLILLLLLATAVLVQIVVLLMALEQTLWVTVVVEAVAAPATVTILFHGVAVAPADTQATVVTVVADKVIKVVTDHLGQGMLDSRQKLVPVAGAVGVMRDRAVA